MKVVILAGGFGTRFSEETEIKPKPMIEIGGKPIIWHIMKIYSFYGFNEFVICLGYKGYVIKEFFYNYSLHMSDVTFDFNNSNNIEVHKNSSEPWKVTLVDTGLDSMTGGRLKRVQDYVNNQTFMLTYGDGVGDININSLLEHHRKNDSICTITSVAPTGRFGYIEVDNDFRIKSFNEKPKSDKSLINGGFFVFEPEIFNLIEGDETILEVNPMLKLVELESLTGYIHNGFWHPMDTLRDKKYLESLWNEGHAPWKLWS